MARRKIEEEHVNHERWLVSYADFITLLFAFFVVMYSISQVNESKYRVLSNTLTAAFNQPEVSLNPVQIGETVKTNPINLIQLDAAATRDGADAADPDRLPEAFRDIGQQMERALGELIRQNLVAVRGNEEWLEIELRSSLLFDSGDATLSVPALQLLGEIAGILREHANPVRVEGFTDDRPIHTARYPSNWELSSARSASVVRLFIEEGVEPQRLMAVGYGEQQAIGDNATEEGRARNRRVVLMISKAPDVRPKLAPLTVNAALDDAARAAVSPDATEGAAAADAAAAGAVPAAAPGPADANTAEKP